MCLWLLCSASAGPFCKSNFTISFFVPFAYQVCLGACLLPPYVFMPASMPAPRRTDHTDLLFILPIACFSIPCCVLAGILVQKKGIPKPNNPDVFLYESPAFTAYVAQVRPAGSLRMPCLNFGPLHASACVWATQTHCLLLLHHCS
jgi:hypothetical protein